MMTMTMFKYHKKSLIDAPPNSLMDSIMNPMVNTLEEEGVEVYSLFRNTLGVEGRAGAPRRD
jgi:hypothetical protein